MDGTRTMTEEVRDYRTQPAGRTGETKPSPRMGWLWGVIGAGLLGWLIALFLVGDEPGNAFANGAGESESAAGAATGDAATDGAGPAVVVDEGDAAAVQGSDG